MTKGKLISIEGIEGAGKSTALAFIKKYLTEANIIGVYTREPGGTVLAELIRTWLLSATNDEKIYPETELLLIFAGRAQHLKHLILPALAAGQWVISDRFIDATYAYQGGGRQLNMQQIQWLDRWLVGEHYPDLTLLLDVSPDIGFMRTAQRGAGKDRIEQEKIDFFNRVRDTYLLRAKQDPERIKIINANVTIEEVEKQIQNELGNLLI